MSRVGCPPPVWADLRRVCPDIAADLVTLWRHLDGDRDLSWVVEHLGGLVETLAVEVDTYRDEFRGLGHDWRPAQPTDPVFDPDEWTRVSSGRWEQATADGFHATVELNGPDGARWSWQTLTLDPSLGHLVTIAQGSAATLDDAQRQADTAACEDRNWRRRR